MKNKSHDPKPNPMLRNGRSFYINEYWTNNEDMEAKELRIGNWVHHNPSAWSYRNDDGVISNHGKFNADCFQWEDRDWYAIGECLLFLEDVKPIPLTKEWLVKFGFNKCENAGEFTKLLPYDLVYLYVDLHEGCYTTVDGKDYKTSPYVALCRGEDGYKMHNSKHVHQLQNLYFALTNEELTFKD